MSSAVLTDEERHYYALNRRVYSSFAYFYDLVAFPLKRLRGDVARFADLRRSDVLLDVATGTGEQAFAFAPLVGKVVGIDLSDAMLGVARGKNRFSNVTFERADGTAPPFADASFDAASVSFALHEMPASVRDRILFEMVRLTKPGGRIIVVDYALPQSPLAAWLASHAIQLYERDHYVEFVRSDLSAMLESAGIRQLKTKRALWGLATVVVGEVAVQS